jgi:ABC-type arginine transport system ATPase subunit
MGPELANLRRNPSMMFTLYYLWTHIIIGHATEDIAHQVVVHAAERAREFADVPLPRRGSSRIRRRN